MAEKALTTHISEYRNIIHDPIYPREFCEAFQVEKPSTHIKRPMDDWFWEIADQAHTNELFRNYKVSRAKH